MDSPFVLEATITIAEAKQQGLRIIRPNLPRAEKPFQLLNNKECAAYCLYLANFTEEEIGTLLHKAKRTISRYISKGKDNYNKEKMR